MALAAYASLLLPLFSQQIRLILFIYLLTNSIQYKVDFFRIKFFKSVQHVFKMNIS